MVNYQNGKIYSIRSRSRPDLIYIGSTTQSLSRRFGKHKAMSNLCSSKQILDLGDAYIELIEECKCDNKDQLLRREGQIIRSLECVNKMIAGRTPVEYRQDNKKKIAERDAEYHKDHKEKISEYQKQYRKDNKEKEAERVAKYYQDNKDRISMQIECGCGSIVSKQSSSRHRNTKKHKFWIQIHNFINS